ncbi:hypothetical protein PHMEG_00025723 [Phytophthora megakarya]|uniref:Uncharacterized protein n=1 Tax=Phytophthora megakarya TaxID=4795 RepID=A0A225VBE4_9STRA|nr:hypothetical protein PHMEG_00025723 [Phytophthora megakarya]
MMPVKSTIDRKLLEVVCLYQLRKAVESVSNDEIIMLIKRHVDARVLNYYRDFSTIIENHGLAKILVVGDPDADGFADRMKLRCTILIDNLEPRVHYQRESQTQHKYHQQALEQKGKATLARKPDSSNTKSKSGKKDSRVTSQREVALGNLSAQAPRKEVKPPKTGCWHCQGQHWLRDCPTATEDDKARAVDKMKEIKERTKMKTVQTAPQPGEVMVNDLVALPYCADSGWDSTVIPRGIVDELLALGSTMDIFPLAEPIEAVVARGSSVRCHDTVTVDIVLQTAAGIVHLREVSCLIMEGNSDKLNEMVVAAGDNGFDPKYLCSLHDRVIEYEDIFRVDIGADPPTDIEPLRIKLIDGAKPFRARARRYPPAQRRFLRMYAKRLELLGFIRQNNQIHWVCAAVSVAKPKSPGEFRMTIDYRPVNAMTVPIAGCPRYW